MLKLVLAITLLATAIADVSHILPPYSASPGQPVAILRQEQDVREDGSYLYSYEAENGIAAQEEGLPVSGESGASVSGFYHYKSPEGLPVAIHYVSNENGFQPQGDVLPTPPPVSDAILRSLEYNAAHPTQE